MSKHEEIKQSTPEVEIDENVAELAIKVDDEIKLSEEEFKNLNEVGLEAISGKEDLSKEEKIETIKSEAGAWDRVKIFAREVFSGKESEKRNKTYEKVTEKIINKELINLEKDGNKVVEKNNEARSEKVKLEKELKEMELNKEKFKNTTGVDLENVKKGMEGSKKFNPGKFNEYQTKYDEELASHENLISSKAESLNGFNEKSAEEIENLKTGLNLEERINKFKEPAERKMEKLNGFEKNYSDLLNEAQTERKSYEDKVRGVEKILKGFKGDSELSQDMKKDIQAELDIEKENLRKLKEAENKLRDRLETIKANKKETSDFIFKMECIGKTPEEIKKMKKEKQEEEKAVQAPTQGRAAVDEPARQKPAAGGTGDDGSAENIAAGADDGANKEEEGGTAHGKEAESSTIGGEAGKKEKKDKGYPEKPTLATQASMGEKEVRANPENEKMKDKKYLGWFNQIKLFRDTEGDEIKNFTAKNKIIKKDLYDHNTILTYEEMRKVFLSYLNHKKEPSRIMKLRNKFKEIELNN